MVPAMRVFNPSVGKRVIVLIPDLPAVSFAQLSDRPAPSDVTTPRPVTTTSGRPNLSLPDAAISVLLSRHARLALSLRLANARHRSRGLGSNSRPLAAPSPSSHRAETAYHDQARPWPVRCSLEIAAPTRDRDMIRW